MELGQSSAAQNKRRKSFFYAIPFILPYLVINLVFLTCPLFKGIWMSFHDWDLLKSRPVWIGIHNYFRLFEDPFFWTSLIHTLEFTALIVPLVTIMGLGLALLLNRRGYAFALMRGIFYSSGAFSVTVVTLVWLTIYNPTRGLIGQTLKA